MDTGHFHATISYAWRTHIFDILTEKINRENKFVNFVQVGANDGVSGDPIHSYVRDRGWLGALVEPVPYLFERLKQNYGQREGIYFHQACCDSVEGIAPFYMVDQAAEAVSGLGSFLSSFDKATILRHAFLIPDLEKFIREIPIETIRVDTVISRSDMSEINVLAVDTEGVDDRVVNSLNLDIYKPELILMEHKHISLGALMDLNARMEYYDYRELWMYEDILYVRGDFFESTTRKGTAYIKKIKDCGDIMYKP